jgi:hypothetical protein
MKWTCGQFWAMCAVVLLIGLIGCGQTMPAGKALYTEATADQLNEALEKQLQTGGRQLVSLASIDAQTQKTAKSLDEAAGVLKEIRDLLSDQKTSEPADTALTSAEPRQETEKSGDPIQTAADTPEKPKLFVAYANFHCQPCNNLKADIAAGKFDDFEVIEELKPGTDANGYPVIRWTKPDGLSKWVNSYTSGTLQSLKDEILNGKVASSVDTYARAVDIEVTRNPGPRWHWNGDWSPSEETAAEHLLNAHGIDASGMSMQQMMALHDNAHNAEKSVSYVSAPSRRVRVQVRSGSCPNCF